MIYTVTFNPSLDYVMMTDCFTQGCTNRSAEELITVGGKGINVSLVLAELGIKSTMLGFVGGFTGEYLENSLKNELIENKFVRISNGMTRINVKLVGREMTEINAGGPCVSPEEIDKLLLTVDLASEGDVIVLAGSTPKNVSKDIYEKILARLSGKNVKSVVDATGELLLKTLQYNPYLIKPNIDELGDLFDTHITDEKDVVKYAQILKDKGAKNVLVSMGAEGAILVSENGEVIKRKAVGTGAVNPVGAGDSMVAGFLAGSGYGFDVAMDYAIAAGGATACTRGLATKEKIEQFLNMIDKKEN